MKRLPLTLTLTTSLLFQRPPENRGHLGRPSEEDSEQHPFNEGPDESVTIGNGMRTLAFIGEERKEKDQGQRETRG